MYEFVVAFRHLSINTNVNLQLKEEEEEEDVEKSQKMTFVDFYKGLVPFHIEGHLV